MTLNETKQKTCPNQSVCVVIMVVTCECWSPLECAIHRFVKEVHFPSACKEEKTHTHITNQATKSKIQIKIRPK